MVRLIKEFHYSRPIYSARKIGSAIHLFLITQKKKHKTANASLFPIHITRAVACQLSHCQTLYVKRRLQTLIVPQD